jgi:hypothetical protein
MIATKVQCGCGQKYAFDTEPIDGRLGAAVSCPACGADGTAAANSAITQTLATVSARNNAPEPAVNASSLRISTAPATDSATGEAPKRPASRHVSAHNLPQMDRFQAEHEARAKISWGDAPEDVAKFLMLHGFSAADASTRVNAMFQERAATIRQNGIGKIVKGVIALCVPAITALVFLSIGMFLLKVFAVTVMVGLWGAWQVLKGIFMVVSPKTEYGDVAEQ